MYHFMYWSKICPSIICPSIICPSKICPSKICPSKICPSKKRPSKKCPGAHSSTQSGQTLLIISIFLCEVVSTNLEHFNTFIWHFSECLSSCHTVPAFASSTSRSTSRPRRHSRWRWRRIKILISQRWSAKYCDPRSYIDSSDHFWINLT